MKKKRRWMRGFPIHVPFFMSLHLLVHASICIAILCQFLVHSIFIYIPNGISMIFNNNNKKFRYLKCPRICIPISVPTLSTKIPTTWLSIHNDVKLQLYGVHYLRLWHIIVWKGCLYPLLLKVHGSWLAYFLFTI